MSAATIHHNPVCGTSRNTLAMIRQGCIEPEIIEYLKHPPTRQKLAALQTEFTGKALEMLTQAAPHVKKIGMLGSPTAPHSPVLRAIETAGVNLGVLLQLTPRDGLVDAWAPSASTIGSLHDASASWSLAG